MTTRPRTMTADELLRMPDDGFRHELVRGELRTMALAGFAHGNVAMRIGWPLAQHVQVHDLGVVSAAETGFVLTRDPDTVRAPDVAFVRRDRIDPAGETRGFFPGPPDLAVEVVSPGDTRPEVEEKVAAWLAAGTRLVLAVDPRTRTVTRYRGDGEVMTLALGDTVDGEDVVPGWTVRVADLFA